MTISPTTLLKTPGYHGYAVQFSPFRADLIAVATGTNYGMVGKGRIWILSTQNNQLIVNSITNTEDAVFDVCWSERDPTQVLCASGNVIKLYDFVRSTATPIQQWEEHKRECFAVNWNHINKNEFVSCSWDLSIKVYTPESPTSLFTIQNAHNECIYNVIYTPNSPSIIATCSGDSTIKLWDLRSNLQSTPMSTLIDESVLAPNSPHEVLAIDFNKYQPHILYSAGVDRSIKTWDIRMMGHCKQPISVLPNAHALAIRSIKTSPHSPDILATTSYDMSIRLWTRTANSNTLVPLATYAGHKEFVFGMDFSLFQRGRLASCSWDETVQVLDVSV